MTSRHSLAIWPERPAAERNPALPTVESLQIRARLLCRLPHAGIIATISSLRGDTRAQPVSAAMCDVAWPCFGVGVLGGDGDVMLVCRTRAALYVSVCC